MRNPVVLSEKPCSAVQRPSNSYPALASPAPETKTLLLQEPDARSKKKGLDYRAQEKCQSRCKQVLRMPETTQKAPRSVNVLTAKFASGSRISSIFQYHYGYLRTLADPINLQPEQFT